MTPTTRKRKQEQDQALQEAMQQATTPTDMKRQKLSVRTKEEGSPSTTRVEQPTSLSKSPSAKGAAHVITFDDDEEDVKMKDPKVGVKPSPKHSTQGKEESPEAESDDDDEAPEAVSTQQAANAVKKSARAAQEKIQEQAAEQKRKRQERDALLKTQALERKANEQEDSLALPAAQKPGRKRAEKRVIPDVLPAEFLTDSSSEDEDDESLKQRNSQSLQRTKATRNVGGVEKRLTQLDRGPRDEVVGSTVYRVAKKTEERMAPRAKKLSTSTKDRLLKRNRMEVKPKSGFFKNR